MAKFGREDYNWETLPTIIGEDEPVFVMRAQDENFIPMLEKYKELIEESISDDDGEEGMSEEDADEFCNNIDELIMMAKEWQEDDENDFGTPDL